MRNKLYILFALLICCVFAYNIYGKERQLKAGDIFYLRLAPVDPRSLMQGDYMILNYEINRSLSAKDFAADKAVLAKDGRGIASLAGPYDGKPLAEGEFKVNIVKLNQGSRGGGLSVAPASFMFQEGRREKYEAAKYAILRAAPSGAVLLTGLADGDLKEIK